MVRRRLHFLITLCSLILFVSTFALSFKADGNNSVTIDTNNEVIQGNTYYAYVSIDSLSDVSSLKVSIHYDSSVLEVKNTYNQISCTLYDNSKTIDTLAYSYLFGNDSPSTKTNLFYFTYTIKDNAELGKHYFDILVEEAYDAGLNIVNVLGSRKNFSVKEKVISKSVYAYGTSSVNSKKEEEFEVSYQFGSNQIASGALEVQYDKELFEFVSLTQLGFLNSKLVDVNTNLDGSINISFVSTEYSNSYDIVRIKFKTIGNTDTSSKIKFIASDLYDLDLTSISCSGYETSVNLTYDSSFDENLPKMFLTSEYDQANNQVVVKVNISKNSMLGAGDFILEWNNSQLSYASNTKKLNASFFNVNDKDVNNGKLKFSIISLTDIVSEGEVIVIVFDVIQAHDEATSNLEIKGSGLADSLTNPIQMNFVNCSQSIPGKHQFSDWVVTKEATCTEKGLKKRICSVCNHEETQEIDALGHTWSEEWTIDVEATCEQDGSKSHHCTRCDEKKDITVIEKTGHEANTSVKENVIEATCTTGGSYDEVTYCKKCNKELSRTHKEVDPLGHNYGDWIIVKEATCTEKGLKKRICSKCNHEETLEIEATGHTANCQHLVTFKDYDGTILSSQSYHYGESVTAPNNPTRQSDNTYEYQFIGWGEEVVACDGDKIYTAVYDSTYINYTITFKNFDEAVLSSQTYHYGDSVVVPNNPTRQADNTYTYEFKSWDQEVVAVSGNTTYTATYNQTFIEYTITFKNYDGTVLSEKKYHYSESVVAPANPTRKSDSSYTYTFKGWDKEIVAVNGNATYTATYTSKKISSGGSGGGGGSSSTKYKITFKNYDGTIISETSYKRGSTVTVPANPTKPSDKAFSYVFKGWDKEIVAVNGAATYTAVFTAVRIEYKVIFMNYDGTILSEELYYYEGTVVEPAAPTRPADNTYTYTFSGWDKEIVEVSENVTYTALYTPTFIDYTVVFKNYDGTVLQEKIYHYGEKVLAPQSPLKPSNETFNYEFSGWDKEVVDCNGNCEYAAMFNEVYINYIVVFKNYDDSVILEATYHYGDSVTEPEKPLKESDEKYDYEFSGWDKEVVNCNGNATYTATFTQTESLEYISSQRLIELSNLIDEISSIDLDTYQEIISIQEKSKELTDSDKEKLDIKLQTVINQYVDYVKAINSEYEVAEKIESYYYQTILDLISYTRLLAYAIYRGRRWEL